MIYNLLAGGLNPIDYLLITALVVLVLGIAAVVVWQKLKGKNGCGCDCGSCQSCPSAQNGKCGGCTACGNKEETDCGEEK
jgi:hypothetical protein